MLHVVTASAGGRELYHVERQRMPFDAFAQLLAYDLNPETTLLSVEAGFLKMRTPTAQGIETCVYRDSPAQMLPLVAAVAYHAHVNQNHGVVDVCDELLDGSTYTLDLERMSQIEQFETNAVIVLAVAGIKPEVSLLTRYSSVWELALSVALIFENPGEEWRETVIKTLMLA